MNILSQVDSVDFIVKLNELSPIKLLNILRPSLHCKGGDYKKKELKEYNLLKNLELRFISCLSKEKNFFL